MKPAPFTYHAPRTAAEAVSALAEYGDEAKVLAGGQSLVPMLALRLARPAHLIDVNGVAELTGSRRENGQLVAGAMTRHAALERDREIAAAVPLLRLAAPHIGHFQIRSRGTLGGSLAHADAAAELPAVARALDAEMVVRSASGERTIPAAEFFQMIFTTALEPEELLTAVRFPVWGSGSGFAVEEIARRHGDFALAGAVCAVQVAAGRIERVALSVDLTVNGRSRRVRVEPRKTLADAIREDLHLTGTHLGCEHGVCGACTVLVDGEAVRSCLMFTVQAAGTEVTTVEGLSADAASLSPVQRAFQQHHGLQCGFCTPGFVVSATAFLAANPDPSDAEIRAGLSGNLCRCTGYQGIVRAVRAAAAELAQRQEGRA
jgi:carbon-monoxide dehydrogenase medium subunit